MIQRVLEITHHRKRGGVVIAPWTLIAMGVVHFSFYVGGLAELLFLNRLIHGTVVIAGILIFLAGFLLRKWVIHSLGELWSVHIEIRAEHPLVTTGPYAFCRHPNYLAILLELMGYCLTANAYFTLIVSLLAYSPVLFLRIRLEESEMIRKFGNSYLLYRKKTPALVPFVGRRKTVPPGHTSPVFLNDNTQTG